MKLLKIDVFGFSDSDKIRFLEIVPEISRKLIKRKNLKTTVNYEGFS